MADIKRFGSHVSGGRLQQFPVHAMVHLYAENGAAGFYSVRIGKIPRPIRRLTE